MGARVSAGRQFAVAAGAADSRTNSGLRKIRRKVSLDFAKFDWTRQHQLSRPGDDCEECPALGEVRNQGLDDPSASRPDRYCNFVGVNPRWRGRLGTHDRCSRVVVSGSVCPGIGGLKFSKGRMGTVMNAGGTGIVIGFGVFALLVGAMAGCGGDSSKYV